ncbi:DNA repair protein [Sphingomonas sp. MG17]|uniref:DNA repair protein n=1 Tax=Sphingomonas tagetis TaxID=2949092 RepID=A0A9X2KQN8_9SPHN|nr:JAB domain-containing protein [Sphingomonas tagetis]MCP3731968.1 DNA repair protein [Sphingomonas tagetis]
MASPALARLADPFEAVTRQLTSQIADERVEVAVFAYCDGHGRALGFRHARSGLADAVELPVRRIAIDALAFDAAVVMMAHNHPSGEAWPSRADREVTRRIAAALRVLGVRLHDHVIVAGRRRWSFRGAGLL